MAPLESEASAAWEICFNSQSDQLDPYSSVLTIYKVVRLTLQTIMRSRLVLSSLSALNLYPQFLSSKS